ncbi:CBS domain-containing protein [Aquabacterium fontiphilum]|jgi:CBS domain-containing protein|uniref:CBS domain-containing protein n=1 Tax=Aquabacterium fontiphilum TaxID=450365 RepID=UPI001376E9BD|nr:CBS domain-containing protein [Aquabacterium fontiphilum]NBD22109.1 CBS domain-containing protein [Aquabacterium fontiphilum]
MTQVFEAMTRGVRTIGPSDTLIEAAKAMTDLDVGALPVCDGERLLGMVTDRDIVIRGVAQGCANDQACVSDVMTEDVLWCYEDQDVESVLDKMRGQQVRRVPVVDQDKRLVGMLSLGDVAVKAQDADMNDTLEGISEPAEPMRSAPGATPSGSAPH